MITNEEFVERAIRRLVLRRAQRNITVKGGQRTPRTGEWSLATIPYTPEELALFESIESDLIALLNIFGERIASQQTEAATWTVGT